MSIKSEMTALADAVRNKSGVTGKLSISGMTSAVSNISVGGSDIDLSGVTVAADKMLSGIVAVGADGQKVTGNIQTVTPAVNKNTFSVGKGYVASAFTETIAESGASNVSGNVVTVPAGYLSTDRVETIAEATVTETGDSVTITPGYVAEELNYDIGGSDIDLSGVTVTADKMLSGIVAVGADGNKVTGNIKTSKPYRSGYSVIVPQGYVEEDKTVMVEVGASSNCKIVRVTEFVPENNYAYSAVSEITISGIGFVGWQDEDYPEDSYGEDYSMLNGTYTVVNPSETDPRNREYCMKVDGEYFDSPTDVEVYLAYFYYGEDDAGWAISLHNPVGIHGYPILTIYEPTLFFNGGDGTKTWWSDEYETEVEIEHSASQTYYPEREAVLRVKEYNDYSNTPGDIYDRWETVPIQGKIYAARSDEKCLMGRPIYMQEAPNYGNGLVMLTHFSYKSEKLGINAWDSEIVEEVGLCSKLRYLGGGGTDILRSFPENPYSGSKFGTQFMYFGDFNPNESSGGLMIYNMPDIKSFTIDYWAFINDAESNTGNPVGGVVLYDAQSYRHYENEDEDENILVRATDSRTHAVFKQWHHHAFTHSYQSGIVTEFINGVEVATHEFKGRLRYDSELGEDTYRDTLGGTLIFTPGAHLGRSSIKGVCQLRIWNVDLSLDIWKAMEEKRATHFR